MENKLTWLQQAMTAIGVQDTITGQRLWSKEERKKYQTSQKETNLLVRKIVRSNLRQAL